MDIIFNIVGQKISRLDSNFVVGDSKNYLTAVFAFSGEWDNLSKTAVFKNDDYTLNMTIKNNACKVPHELLSSGSFFVSVFGGDLITTNTATVRVTPSGISEGGEPVDPTPSVYAQIYKIAEDASNKVDDLEDRANSGEFKGDKGDTGEDGKDGEDGAKGDTGDTGGTGEQGTPGKSAYEYATEGGYTDTEQAFSRDLGRVNEEVRLSGGNAFTGVQTIDGKFVATRESTPSDKMLMYWSNELQTFVSSGISVETLTKLLDTIQLVDGEVVIKAKVNAQQFNIEV